MKSKRIDTGMHQYAGYSITRVGRQWWVMDYTFNKKADAIEFINGLMGLTKEQKRLDKVAW